MKIAKAVLHIPIEIEDGDLDKTLKQLIKESLHSSKEDCKKCKKKC